jgi:Flp pilus assembly protein TadG
MKNVDLQNIPLVGQFRRDERGNIAVTFALALLPMLGFVGAAVDYSRASSAKTSLQSALDTSALMISKEAPGMTTAALQARGQAVFDALFKNKGFGIALTTTYTAQSGQTPANLVMAGRATWRRISWE